MTSDSPYDRLAKLRLIPVIAIEDADQAPRLADALLEGGLPCAEVTFRTAAASQAISAMAARADLLVGAGTVLTPDQAQQAVDHGAQFIVSPGLNPRVVRYCLDHDIPVSPGISTPTEIEAALEFGLQTLKFFPAEAFGGLATLNAISAPYGSLKFIPTGGINPTNLPLYLASPKVLACGGSWMVAPKLIANNDFTEITRLVRAAVELVEHAKRETKSRQSQEHC